MVIDCEEVPEAVGVVEVGVGEHAIVNICQIDAEGLRILREEPRRTRVEQDGRVIGLDERGRSPTRSRGPLARRCPRVSSSSWWPPSNPVILYIFPLIATIFPMDSNETPPNPKAKYRQTRKRNAAKPESHLHVPRGLTP